MPRTLYLAGGRKPAFGYPRPDRRFGDGGRVLGSMVLWSAPILCPEFGQRRLFSRHLLGDTARSPTTDGVAPGAEQPLRMSHDLVHEEWAMQSMIRWAANTCDGGAAPGRGKPPSPSVARPQDRWRKGSERARGCTSPLCFCERLAQQRGRACWATATKLEDSTLPRRSQRRLSISMVGHFSWLRLEAVPLPAPGRHAQPLRQIRASIMKGPERAALTSASIA
jgi:hypothetical protein